MSFLVFVRTYFESNKNHSFAPMLLLSIVSKVHTRAC